MGYNLQELSDKLEIQELCHDYSEAIDQQDFDRLDDIFTTDAFIDYSALGGEKGDYAATKAFLASALPMFTDYYHMVSNVRIHLDGDEASGRVMCFNPMGIPMEGKQHMMFLGLFYLDKYVRTDKGWRIKERVEERSWGYNIPQGTDTGE